MQPFPKAPTNDAPVVLKTVEKLSDPSNSRQDHTTLSNDFMITAPIISDFLPIKKIKMSAVAIKIIANMKILILPPISFLSINFAATNENGNSRQYVKNSTHNP